MTAVDLGCVRTPISQKRLGSAYNPASCRPDAPWASGPQLGLSPALFATRRYAADAACPEWPLSGRHFSNLYFGYWPVSDVCPRPRAVFPLLTPSARRSPAAFRQRTPNFHIQELRCAFRQGGRFGGNSQQSNIERLASSVTCERIEIPTRPTKYSYKSSEPEACGLRILRCVYPRSGVRLP